MIMFATQWATDVEKTSNLHQKQVKYANQTSNEFDLM